MPSSRKASPSSTAAPTSSPASLPRSSVPWGSTSTTPGGAGTGEERLKEQDADGIDAEVLYATEARNTAIRDKDAFLAIRARLQ